MRLAPAILALLAAPVLFSTDPAAAAGDGEGGSLASYEGTESVLSMVGKVDVGCILRTWKILGVSFCVVDGVPRACIIIENAYPVGIIEAVRKPLATHLAEASLFLATLPPMAKLGVTSSHTTDTGSGTGLQFSEARAYQFVPQLPILSAALPVVVPPGDLFSVSYFSEFDVSWRNDLADALVDPAEMALKRTLPACSVAPRLQDCAWGWGSYLPRSGFAVHPSEVMAAYLLSLRAGRVAARPTGRVVLGAYPYEPRTGHYIQMVRPAWRSCVSIGWPGVRAIETGAASPEGGYFFIHFGLFQACYGCWGARLAEPRPPGP